MNDTNVEAAFPLSPAQEEMLFLTLSAGGLRPHVEQRAITYRGSLDVACLKLAWIDGGGSKNHGG